MEREGPDSRARVLISNSYQTSVCSQCSAIDRSRQRRHRSCLAMLLASPFHQCLAPAVLFSAEHSQRRLEQHSFAHWCGANIAADPDHSASKIRFATCMTCLRGDRSAPTSSGRRSSARGSLGYEVQNILRKPDLYYASRFTDCNSGPTSR